MKRTAQFIAEQLLDDDALFEMANIPTSHTGVPFVLYFSGDPVTKHHRPRGKVRVSGNYYPFSIDDPVEWLAAPAPGVSAKNFAKIVRFVELNRDTLMAYWDGTILTPEFIARLRPIQ